MGSVNLQSGANVSLTAANPLLDEVVIGFGWDVVKGNGPVTELVPSAIMLDSTGRSVSDEHMVFFNQLASPDGSTTYVSGDDDEQLEVNLALIPESVSKIVFVVYADPDIRRPGSFGSVRNAYIHVDDRSGSEIVRFKLENTLSEVTAVIFGELYRHNGSWKFRAGGQGYSTGLAGVAKDFGVNL